MTDQKNGHYVDQRILETAECLIEIYKKNFGSDWQRVFTETVIIRVG
jgi:hypothetical protein